MIKKICKWAISPDYLPLNTFATLDTQTSKLLEYEYIDISIDDTNYYPLIEHYDEVFPCQTCVNLLYVDSCIAEIDDDLKKYGFKCIREDIEGKSWVRTAV